MFLETVGFLTEGLYSFEAGSLSQRPPCALFYTACLAACKRVKIKVESME